MTQAQQSITNLKICKQSEINKFANSSLCLAGHTTFLNKKGEYVWLALVNQISKKEFQLLKQAHHQNEFTVFEFEGNLYQMQSASGYYNPSMVNVVYKVTKRIEEKEYTREVEKFNDTIKLTGENIDIDYSWESGGKAGGEYLDTYTGTATIDGKKYIVYCHWSCSGPLGIYDETNTFLLGELFPFKKDKEGKTVVSFFKFEANA